MRKTALVMMVVLAVVVCVAVAVGQDQKPWTKPGTAAGQEIVGPDGGTMVWVPTGSFQMGTSAEEVQYAVQKLGAEAKGLADEQPARQVEMDGFWIGKHEVTNAQYRAFCATTGRQFPEDSNQGDEHPVVFVSWNDAVAYCEHYGLSLPTEAQWEYAARGPESRRFPWGNEWDGSRLCWRKKQGRAGKTFGVGSFPQGPSWSGALDLAGNVPEWCADWYQEDYYKNASSKNPPGPSEEQASVIALLEIINDQLVTYLGKARVLRGGSWNNDLPGDFRCANRYRSNPRFRYDLIGFRCARGP